MDKRVHHVITEQYCDYKAQCFPDSYLAPASIAAMNYMFLTKTHPSPLTGWFWIVVGASTLAERSKYRQ